MIARNGHDPVRTEDAYECDSCGSVTMSKPCRGGAAARWGIGETLQQEDGMIITVKGAITPPRGTPGANSAYMVDLEINVPDQAPTVTAPSGAVIDTAALERELKRLEVKEMSLRTALKGVESDIKSRDPRGPGADQRTRYHAEYATLTAELELTIDAQTNLRVQLKDRTHAMGAG